MTAGRNDGDQVESRPGGKMVWQGQVTQAAAKYGEHTQMATVCCNACRTCVQTNLIGLAIAGVAAASTWVARIARRPAKTA